ncbi:MAG: BrnT family toxin [Pyrinomonadaceae bacterium]
MEFEWDPKKAKSNLRKHRVSFNEAATAFNDILSLTFEDEAHSDVERRYATLGMSYRGRILVVAHTMHGEKVRIISAREATSRERKWYEEENK